MSYVIKVCYPNGVEKILHKKEKYNPVLPTFEEKIGKTWLVTQMREKDVSRKLTRDFCSLNCLLTYCAEKNCWDVNEKFFKNLRKISADDVEKATVAQLLSLDGEYFFSIVDLLSAEQALEILNDSDASHYRKLGLWLFNKSAAAELSLQLDKRWSDPVEEKVHCAAKEAMKSYRKYSHRRFIKLQQSAQYQHLEAMRVSASKTLSADGDFNNWHSKANWKDICSRQLVKGITMPITVSFLERLNQGLRGDDQARGVRIALPMIERETWYLPTCEVKEGIDTFVSWFNDQMRLCDQGKNNPIVFAALAGQRLVSIHPFHNGNGRTGRLLTDLVLRRYKLLPAAWGDQDQRIALFACGGYLNQATPSTAVSELIDGLDRSYRLIKEEKTHLQKFTDKIASCIKPGATN